jgi:hypothetical protein
MDRALFAIFTSGLLLVSTLSCSSALPKMHSTPLVTLSAARGPITSGGDIVLTVRVASNQVKVTAVQWTFRYDARSVSPVLFAVAPVSFKANKTISCSSQKDETRCLLWGVNASPIPDGDVAEARFRLRGGAPIQKSAVMLDHPIAVSSDGELLAVGPPLSGRKYWVLQAPSRKAPARE